MGKYVWPCPDYSSATSEYGDRVHPIYGGIRFHDGIDLAASLGTSILACGPGTVTRAADVKDGYGNCIYVDHGNGFTSFYAHCSTLYVSKGAKVKAGQRIAAVGTTGSSTGEHLHFGIHIDGKPDNPRKHVKDTDTLDRYTGPSGGSARNVVRAMFTAYYPEDNAMEGGFYDALGNLLDTSKRTCAAPTSVPFGSKVTVQGTGTGQDGVTYTVNDRGGAINIQNGVYHFDLLMSTNEECNRWGVKYGTAIIDGDGEGIDAGQSSKEITRVVVKSITGAAGTRKEILRKTEPHLSAGIELLLQNSRMELQNPMVEGDIVWETTRTGSPASLKFTVVKDDILSFHEGNPVSFRFNGEPVFYGYVFKKERSDSRLIQVTCYDQLRYFKNKDSISYADWTYSELLRVLAKDYGLTCGTIADTKYKIPQRIEETTLFDICGNAADETLVNTGKIYVLYDDFGKLTLKPYESMLLPIWIDENTAQEYSYASSIDNEVYDRVKLAYDNGETGEREIYVTNDTASQGRWGVLQYYAKLDSALSSADMQTKAKVLLDYYNVKQRELSIKKVFGDVRARAGASVAVGMGLGDINISNYMCIEKARHTFSFGLHTMDLTLSGIRGEFHA